MDTSIHKVNKIVVGKIRSNKIDTGKIYYYRNILITTERKEILEIRMFGKTRENLSLTKLKSMFWIIFLFFLFFIITKNQNLMEVKMKIKELINQLELFTGDREVYFILRSSQYKLEIKYISSYKDETQIVLTKAKKWKSVIFI